MSNTVRTPVTFHAVQQQSGTHGACPTSMYVQSDSATLILPKTSSPTLLSMFFSQPSRLIIQLASTLNPIPVPETLVLKLTRLGFNNVVTFADVNRHMLEMDFAPESGWSEPVIKPYGPVALDPACSVFHYTPALFEGIAIHVFRSLVSN